MMQLSVYKEHYKETIRLGVPIMLGQLGIIVVGFADNIMVGHHSTAELAAASFVNNFFNFFSNLFSRFESKEKENLCAALRQTQRVTQYIWDCK